jgi:hypothetical protein
MADTKTIFNLSESKKGRQIKRNVYNSPGWSQLTVLLRFSVYYGGSTGIAATEAWS